VFDRKIRLRRGLNLPQPFKSINGLIGLRREKFKYRSPRSILAPVVNPPRAFCFCASPKIHFLALSKVGKCISTLLPPINRVPNRTHQYLDFPIRCGPTLIRDGRSVVAERFVLSGERTVDKLFPRGSLSEIRVCFDNTIVTV
jgi:hypothetical protein